MSLPAKSTLFLYLIIAFGGFGILRAIIHPHDSLSFISILASFVCAGIFLHTSREKPVRISADAPVKRVISLSRFAADTFTFFPGMTAGYAGYTDYNMMRARLNDDLLLRPPEDQFALLGFGIGFLDTLKARITAEDIIIVRCDEVSTSEAQFVGWLAFIQEVGTDNDGPSTKNLHGAIQEYATQVYDRGPIMMDYWRKVHDRLEESLGTSDIGSSLMDELRSAFLVEQKRGERIAKNAHIAERH